MARVIGSLICGIGIAGLFFLDRGEKTQVSKALVIPAVWMLLNTTHPLSFWLGMSNLGSYTTEAYVEGNPFDRNVALVIQLAALIVLCGKSAKVGAILRKNPLILAYFSFCLVSVLWSDFPFVTFKRWIKALGDVQMVLVILVELDTFAPPRSILTPMGFFLFPFPVVHLALNGFFPLTICDPVHQIRSPDRQWKEEKTHSGQDAPQGSERV